MSDEEYNRLLGALKNSREGLERARKNLMLDLSSEARQMVANVLKQPLTFEQRLTAEDHAFLAEPKPYKSYAEVIREVEEFEVWQNDEEPHLFI